MSRFWDMGNHDATLRPFAIRVCFSAMPKGLVRYHRTGNLHFITFSCFHRYAHLASPAARNLFQDALERTRLRNRFVVAGYVVMPQHVHFLIGEPLHGTIATAVKALKLSVALRRIERPF